jgi:hypothetical protein
MTLGDLDKLIRLEAFLSDEPESRHEQVLHDLGAKSDVELRQLVENELKALRQIEIEAARQCSNRGVSTALLDEK